MSPISLYLFCLVGIYVPRVSSEPFSRSYTKIPHWNNDIKVSASIGSPYGPMRSIDENLHAIEVPNKAGALVWAINGTAYIHPELRSDFNVGQWLRSRPNLGVCMSGGSLRAATCALGWLRGLNHLGLLQKTRFLGANSGSTWTILPLVVKQLLEKKLNKKEMDYKYYLGTYHHPEDINLSDEQQLGEIGKILEKSNVLDYKTENKIPSFTDWASSIERNFCSKLFNTAEDNWLNLNNAYLLDEDILNELTMPFPIFVATGYESSDPNQFFPIENTLIYSGIPVDLTSLGIKTKIGGGFVQGLALNSGSLDNKDHVPCDDTNQYMKEFDLPSPVVKLAQLAGASSSFGAAGDAQTLIDFKNPFISNALADSTPFFKARRDDVGFLNAASFKWWSPSKGGDPVELCFVDGGMYDQMGVLPLLRRGCSTIILCNACDKAVSKTKFFGLFDNTEKDFYDVAQYFGRCRYLIPKLFLKPGFGDTLNTRSKVFACEEFDILMDEMRELRKRGKPLVVRKKLTLLINKAAGIYDTRQVDMIFIFNSVIDEFEKNLNKAQRHVSKKINPHINTFDLDYSLEMVNKLSSLSSYSLVKGLSDVNFDIGQVENIMDN